MLYYYTDGSASNNKTRTGGWGVICLNKDYQELWRRSNGEPNTTSNRMELKAIIFALKKTPQEESAIIYTDSAYISNAISFKWYEVWEQNGWQNAKKQPVANVDLWQELLQLYRTHNVKIEKVQGHSGVHWNEEVDILAVSTRRNLERSIKNEN